LFAKKASLEKEHEPGESVKGNMGIREYGNTGIRKYGNIESHQHINTSTQQHDNTSKPSKLEHVLWEEFLPGNTRIPF